MMRIRFNLFVVALLVSAVGAPAMRAAGASEPPDFSEVYALVKAHLVDVSDTELNQTAVQGLLEKLGSNVWLVSETTETNIMSQTLLTKSKVFDGLVGYLQVGRVGAGLAKDVAAAYKELSRTNELKGLVLDLRFTDGQDYAEAGAVADLFLSGGQPLLDWGAAAARSTAKTNALKLPVAVLVNRETAAAAEALAAVLRETGAGLVLGGNTAGRAMIAQEFPLKNGQRLRIATAGVKLGSGEVLSARGVKPDIEVAVSVEEEKAYLADPFVELPGTNLLAAGTASGTNSVTNGTNRLPRRRITEADLVRERREGFDFRTNPTVGVERESVREKPVVQDPVLARALDLIKGLAVVRQSPSR